jgi:succinate dehydrogenase hydrophobic anchor subunit
MNARKITAVLLLMLSALCLILAILLGIGFAVHYAEYCNASYAEGMTKLVNSLTLTLEILSTSLLLSLGTLFSWLGYKFTNTEKFKKTLKITVVICMILFGISVLGLIYFLYI